MTDETMNPGRRKAMKLLATTMAAVPVVLLDSTRPAFADDLPQLTEDDPQAVALGYKHDTTTVDGSKHPNHAAEQQCQNCQLVQAAEGEWRPCAIFPGKGVNEKGWCTAWVKKAG